MATKVVMEALSPTMEEGRLVEWKKNEGDAVAVGDVLAEVETDKAVMELVARAAGTLIKQAVAAGATVPVAATVGVDRECRGSGAWWRGAGTKGARRSAAERGRGPPTRCTRVGRTSPAARGGSSQRLQHRRRLRKVEAARVKASPLAKRMAADKGVDLGGVAGSGPEGRIIKRDVEQLSAAPAPRAAAGPAGAAYADVTLTPMRKTIAKRLAQSIGPIPTYYLTAEVDMERAHEAREALLALDDKSKFSFNDIIIRSAASALRQHPWVNAWWMDDRVRQWHEVHIGVAVAVEEGLITPVIRHADQKTLREIGAEVRELAGRAREKKLKPEEYTGATFSISNLGMFGIDEFTAVINPPEAAILAVGRIEPKPVVIDGEVRVRRRMRITMSCDHRVIDGATGAAFLKTLVGTLENPLALVW